MPDCNSDDEQHRRPESLEDLRWIALVPMSVAPRQINAQPTLRDASGAAAIQQATDTREDHADENRYHAHVPERAEWKVESGKEWNRNWNGDQETAVLRSTSVDWIPDLLEIIAIRAPV